MGIVYRRLLETGINAGPIPSPTSPDDSYVNDDESEFDANMVIVLAVLLCALIVTLGLNAVARCGLRYLLTRGPGEQMAVPGLKKRALRMLPVDVYGSGPNIVATECPICLGEFVDGERVRVLPKCNHGFHVGCIDTWLVSHASCPNCRVSLLDPPCSKELGPVGTAHSSPSLVGTL